MSKKAGTLQWLDGKPDKLKELVELDNRKVFEDAAALFDAQPERLGVDPIAELIRIFLHDLDSRCREQLIGQIRIVFHSYERDDLVGDLDSSHLSAGSRTATSDGPVTVTPVIWDSSLPEPPAHPDARYQ